MPPSPPCYACAPLYAEWQAVLAAIVWGLEAAAYVVLAGMVALLCLRGFVGVMRRVWG